MQLTSEKYDPICLGCNYPLKQLDPSTRACPECARAFDPHDPSSFSTGRPVPDMLRRWIGPAPWIFPAMKIAVIVALAGNVLLAGAICLSWILLGVLSVLVGGVYYIRKLLRHAVVVRYMLPQSLLMADRTPIRKSRRLFVIAAILLFFRLPFYLFFLISLPWLTSSGHYEYSVRPYFADRPHHTMIGIFPIRDVTVNFNGAFYDTWLGEIRYIESDDGRHSWRFHYGYDPLEGLPW